MSKSDITVVGEILRDFSMKTYESLMGAKVTDEELLEEATKAIQSLILQARIDERVKLAQQPLEALPSIFLNDEDVQKRLKAINSIDKASNG